MATENSAKKPIYDTDISKPIPVLIEEVRSRLVEARGNLQDIGDCLGWKDHFDDPIGALNCVLITLYSIKEKVIASENKARKRKEERGELPKSYGVKSRGIGKDYTPGCFVCGGTHQLYHNISMFVRSKEDGEAATALFETGAWLDYRDFEPSWIQVKVGACDAHLANLRQLNADVLTYPYIITSSIVEAAKNYKE